MHDARYGHSIDPMMKATRAANEGGSCLLLAALLKAEDSCFTVENTSSLVHAAASSAVASTLNS